MSYFNGITTDKELKKVFRSLMKEHHPDKGGDTATCQHIRAEYDKAMEVIINGYSDDNYTKNDAGYSFWDSREEHKEVEKNVREAIEKIIMLDDIEIEIIGVWVWVTGDTKKHKEILKQSGYKFTMKKEADGKTRKPYWFFAGKKSGSRGGHKLEDIREKYGSTRITKESKKRITA